MKTETKFKIINKTVSFLHKILGLPKPSTPHGTLILNEKRYDIITVKGSYEITDTGMRAISNNLNNTIKYEIGRNIMDVLLREKYITITKQPTDFVKQPAYYIAAAEPGVQFTGELKIAVPKNI